MNQGTSRISRSIKALEPDHIQMDQRSMLDMLLATLRLAKKINYYNSNNEYAGNWEAFFLNDPIFVISSILDTDINVLKNEINRLDLNSSKKGNSDKLNNGLIQIATIVNNWYNLLKNTSFKSTIIDEIETLKTSVDDALSIMNPELAKDVYKVNKLQDKNEEILKVFNQIYTKVVYFKNYVSKQFSKEMQIAHNHEPHIGLLLAFFKLFRNAQNDLNLLTERHLNYYYETILKQKKQQEEDNISAENRAIIACKLKQGIEKYFLKKQDGFEFDFGNGNESLFYTMNPVQLNQAQIADIKSVYKKEYAGNEYKEDAFSYDMFYESELFDRLREKKGNLDNSKKQFPLIFGQDSSVQSKIGFMVSSSALILEEGLQRIALELRLAEDISTDHIKLAKYFNKAFNLYITCKDGWKKIEHEHAKLERRTIRIHFHLKSSEQRLVSFNADVHGEPYNTEWPCIKVLLNNQAIYHPYRFLKDCVLESIQIKTAVSEVKNISLSNSNGEIDGTIPFAPFGSIPTMGSFLRMQNSKILQKHLSSLTLSINWNNLPQISGGFKTYYKDYPGGVRNKSFRAIIAGSRNSEEGSGHSVNQDIELFKTNESGFLKNELEIPVNIDKLNRNHEIVSSNGALVGNNANLYLILKHPSMGFGHHLFPQIYAKAASKTPRFFKKEIPLPNQPYIPIIDELMVTYENSVKENLLRKQDESTTTIKFFHLFPFGHVMPFPGSVRSKCYLVPQINQKGNLFIGLEHIAPDTILSLGFELIPRTFFHTVISKPKVTWKYLLNNEWEDLSEYILIDQTNGLICSGIVRMEIPETIQLDNTRLPRGKFWIKAEFDGKEDLNSNVRSVFTQAIEVTSKSTIVENSILKKTAKEQIKIRSVSNKKIEKVTGPINLKINDSVRSTKDFYTRVSEQLRHKSRGSTNWDMERLILEQFPEVDKVRVYGRNKYPNELVHGCNVQVVLIPKNRADQLNTDWLNNKLGVDVLQKVKNYLSGFVSPFTNIEVCNPVFELIKVRCRVQFKDKQRSRYLREQLNKDLIIFLSPNISGFNLDVLFEKSFTKIEILNFIESRSYIEEVIDFSAVLIVDVVDRHKLISTDEYYYTMLDGKGNRIEVKNEFPELESKEVLTTISAYAILSSVSKHHIEIYESETLENEVIDGIGDIAIGSDFIVINEKGRYI